VATALALLQIWVRGRRWWYLFPPGSNPPTLTPAMMIGYMANSVLPLRAGEVVRIYVVARRWSATVTAGSIHPFWTTLATLVVERVLDSLAVVLILAILVLVVPVPRFLEIAALVVLAIDLAGIAVLIALVVAPDRCARLIARLASRWPGLQRRALNVFKTFVHGLDGIRAPSHAVPLIAWTVAVWLVPALAAWTMLWALDLRLPFIAGWAVLAFVGLGISIPSAPGYVGVFHAAVVLAVGLFGVSQSVGVGYALLFHASQILPVTLLGWLYLLREHVSLGEAAHARPGNATRPARPG
jgi:glycosyltransferase 2 family protein